MAKREIDAKMADCRREWPNHGDRPLPWTSAAIGGWRGSRVGDDGALGRGRAQSSICRTRSERPDGGIRRAPKTSAVFAAGRQRSGNRYVIYGAMDCAEDAGGGSNSIIRRHQWRPVGVRGFVGRAVGFLGNYRAIGRNRLNEEKEASGRRASGRPGAEFWNTADLVANGVQSRRYSRAEGGTWVTGRRQRKNPKWHKLRRRGQTSPSSLTSGRRRSFST